MAVTRRNAWKIILLTNCIVLAVVFFVFDLRADPLTPPENGRSAQMLRNIIGFGVGDAAIAAAEDTHHREIIAEALLHLGANEGLTILLEDCTYAKAEIADRVTWDESPVDAFDNLWQLEQDIIVSANSLALSAASIASVTERLSILLANYGLDPGLRWLNLTENQRQGIRAAQIERDIIIMNAVNRHRLSRLKAARQAFDAEVENILTQQQLDELSQVRARIEVRLDEMIATEQEFSDG